MGFLDMLLKKREEDTKKYDIFIIYSSKDKKIATEVCSILEKNKLKCFISPRNITNKTSYKDIIMEGINSSKMVLLLFSKNAKESKIVKNELELAFKYHKKIITLNIDNSLPQCELNFMMRDLERMELGMISEETYEKLVNKSRDLCFKPQKNPLIDMKNIKPLKSIEMRKDIVSLMLLFTPIYSISYFYMGFILKNREWFVLGIIFFIPVVPFVVYNYFYGDIYNIAKISIFSQWFLIYWIIAIIYGILIRKEFLSRKTVLKFMSVDDKLFDVYKNELGDYFSYNRFDRD